MSALSQDGMYTVAVSGKRQLKKKEGINELQLR